MTKLTLLNQIKSWTCKTGLLASLGCASTLSAATAIWTGASSDDWSDPGNWSQDISAGGFDLQFGPAAAVFNMYNGLPGYVVNKLDFISGAPAYVLDGDPFSLASGGSINMLSGATGNVEILAPITLLASGNGSHTFSNTSSSAATGARMIIYNDVTGGTTSGSITLNLTGSVGSRNGAANTANEISGIISDGGAAGGLSLNLNTAGPTTGAWYLSRANTYTGNTTLQSGTLFINTIADVGVASSLGRGTTVTLGGNTFLMYTGGAASTNRTFISNGGTWFNNGSGAITVSSTGSIITNSSLVFRGGGNFVIDTVISGAGSISRTDGGTVFLNNTNTFTGNISISTGAFSVKSISDKGVLSSLGGGTSITLGQNQATVPVGRLIVDSATGGATNRDIILNNGTSSPATGSGGIIESAVAGQNVRLRNLAGQSTESRIRANTAADASYLELTGVGNGAVDLVIGGTASSTTTSINMQLVKSGAGTWELSRANLYHRGTQVTGGTLLATNTTGSATGSGLVNVTGTSVIGGTGFITGGAGNAITVASTARIMVGNTHGVASGSTNSAGYTGAASVLTLGATGTAVNITAPGTLQFDIFGAGSTVQSFTDASYDLPTSANDRLQLTTTGTVNLSGAKVQLSALDTANWALGQTWKLIDWANVGTMNYQNMTLETTVLGNYVLEQYLVQGEGYFVRAVSIVPEPSKTLLSLIGLTILFTRRKRKKYDPFAASSASSTLSKI